MLSFLVSAALAAPTVVAPNASLAVTVDRPVVVFVDGAVLDYRDDVPFEARSGPIPAGNHDVKVTRVTGEILWSGVVVLPDGYRVACDYTKLAFGCSGVEPRRGTVAAAVPPPFGVLTAPVAVPAAPPPAPAAPPPPPPEPPSQVRVVVRSSDGEWADVRIDGGKPLELRNNHEGVLVVGPGRHTIEVFEFLEGKSYSKVVFDTRMADHLTVGLTEGQPMTCYDCGPRMWPAD